jgi:hypothetical protein
MQGHNTIRGFRSLALVAGFGLCSVLWAPAHAADLNVARAQPVLFAAWFGTARRYGAVSRGVFGLESRPPVGGIRIGESSDAFFADDPPVARFRLRLRGIAAPAAYRPVAKSRLGSVRFRSVTFDAKKFTIEQPAGVTIATRAATNANTTAVTSARRLFSTASTPDRAGVPQSVGARVRLGGETFDGRVLAQRLQEMQIDPVRSVSNASPQWGKIAGSGVRFPVPVFGKKVALSLSADVNTGGQPASRVAGNLPVLYFPNYIDVFHQTFGAGARLPIGRDIVVGASYNTQGSYGSYGTTTGQSVAERKDQYQGTLTYTIPRTQSSVSVLFQNQQYRDSVLPTYNNLSATREDLNFTVRF